MHFIYILLYIICTQGSIQQIYIPFISHSENLLLTYITVIVAKGSLFSNKKKPLSHCIEIVWYENDATVGMAKWALCKFGLYEKKCQLLS